ncbi:MAG TPA: dihydropteroate synthase [Candidatus Limnocylindrales bacterium]
MTMAERVPFVIIGENVHATRSFARQGKNVVTVDGVEAIAFRDASGAERTCPIAAPVAGSSEFTKNKVKHIRNALLLGLGGDRVLDAKLTGDVTPEDGQVGRDYLIAAAIRQQRNGAHYLYVNVDEISADEGIRVLAMAWLVGLLEGAVGVPLSLDSSSLPVLEAGFRASTAPCGPLMLNSASAERPEALDLVAANRGAVVLSAAGIGGLPSTVDGRVANANAIYLEALSRGIAPADCHVDLLVLPVGVDAQSGNTFLGAVRRFREEHGPEVRLTGGLSNVSFGLPNRRLVNDAFLALAIDAGVDSGIVDPNVADPARAAAMDRDARPFRLAADVLTGQDEYAVEYLTAHRAGELVEA